MRRRGVEMLYRSRVRDRRRGRVSYAGACMGKDGRETGLWRGSCEGGLGIRHVTVWHSEGVETEEKVKTTEREREHRDLKDVAHEFKIKIECQARSK